MSESSIFWTTGSTGDGASPYTQAQVIDWLRRTFVNAATTEFVLKGYADELAPSGAASPVAIAAGAAMVYGFPYESTAIVNVTIPTPVIGTTGHRIVLRADWTLQTVRVTLKSSSDGVATPPGLTQTPGTTYEVSICTLTITTGGAITLTDTRGWLHPNVKVATANLDDDAVTNAKMANNAANTAEIADNAVDDTKAGNRVPQFYRRQGGNASDWSSAGANNYTPSAVRQQGGIIQVSIGVSQKSGSVSITFPVAFSQPPLVYATVGVNASPSTDMPMSPVCKDVTANGFTLELWRSATPALGQFVNVAWLAIGPE